MVLVSALLACSLPQPVAEASLTYDGAPVALEACSFGCGEYPCGGDIADLHGDDLDSFTARITGAYVRLWDDVDGIGGAYYDGDCVESHEETIYDAGGFAVVTTVCDREDDLDLPACWTGALEFTHPEAPGEIDGVYATIDATLDCTAGGHTLAGTLTCKVGDYPE